MSERRVEIDWLRIIAMLAVFIFHCTRFFDPHGWHLKNAEQSSALFRVTISLIMPWIMELFFLVSGFGAWYALKSRTAGRFLLERVKRLLIPLYTVGLFILLPPQFYFDQATNSGYSGAFIEILPAYFTHFRPPGITKWFEMLPLPFAGHLWFLECLFLISLFTLPLLLWLKNDRGRQWITTLADWSNRPGGLFLFAIPLLLTRILSGGFLQAQSCWGGFVWYLIYFVMGYVIAAEKRFTEAFRKSAPICLVLWLASAVLHLYLLMDILNYSLSPHQHMSFMYTLFQCTWTINGWSAVALLIGFGAVYLKSENRVLDYGNEAVLPFYLIHQTIILCVGYFVIKWDMGILSKFLIITPISLILVLAPYELLVRRFNAMRFLFGMNPKPKATRPIATDPIAIAPRQ